MHRQATPSASTDASLVEDDFDIRTTLRQLVEDTGDSCSEAEVDLPPAIRGQLLDPALWQDGLAKYARGTNLAAALADAAGRLIGSTINPRPTWSLLHAKTPALSATTEGAAVGVGCPFSLAPLSPCNCVADALARGGFVVARDRTGLVHFAVPLVLGGHPLGALVAGQVFTRYPEQLRLEHVARQLGLSPGKVWELARLEHPVKHATLEVYADLLATLGQTFLQTRYHTLREAERLAEMTRLRDRALAEMIERRRAEESLEEADHRKDEFLAMLAHELRNPLAPIRNAMGLFRLKGLADPELQWAREVVERQVQQLTRLVDDLLDVSRISSGKINLLMEPVNLAAVVARAVEISRPLIDARKHHLESSLPGQEVRVTGDPARLAQVVSNLLNNAAKYTEEGGRIELSVEANCDQAVLRVRDTGVGIAAAMLPHVFDLFTQVQGSVSRSEGGLGIGLTLVRSLVEMHGGSVTAFSEGLGRGSEFVIRLPLLKETATPADKLGEKEAKTRKVSARSILIVDDNLDAAESLACVLRLTGHDVRTAHDGPGALEAARARPPQVVLLDIDLPGMSGLEVARRMREDPGLKNVLLVALTGYGQDEARLRSQEAGFNAHLVKPVDLDALQALLAHAAPRLRLTGTGPP
jgi:signal transduction histidine kinase/CheY-like chemotaxis protein